VVNYLETIEALPWRLFWDRIEVETLEYPQASIRLRAYTLSFAEGWIGV
jgi:MSHA biogenesis protein MshJ